MNEVYKSVSDTFNARYEGIKCRIPKNWAIYGTANMYQTLYTEEGIGVRPTLSGNIIKESGAHDVNTSKYGSHAGRTYEIKENIDIKDFSMATKDDLYFFVTMASPEMLNNAVVKNIVYHRLSEIYHEELSNCDKNKEQIQQQQQADKEKFDFIYTTISTAVKESGGKSYYDPNHLPNPNEPIFPFPLHADEMHIK